MIPNNHTFISLLLFLLFFWSKCLFFSCSLTSKNSNFLRFEYQGLSLKSATVLQIENFLEILFFLLVILSTFQKFLSVMMISLAEHWSFYPKNLPRKGNILWNSESQFHLCNLLPSALSHSSTFFVFSV